MAPACQILPISFWPVENSSIPKAPYVVYIIRYNSPQPTL